MFLSYFRAALRLFPGCCFDYIMIFAKRKECFFVILHLCTISTKQCWFIRVFIAQKRHLYSKTQQKATRGRSMKARPTQSRKGVKGQLPLAGSRDSVPCGVWGNAPTVPRATSMPKALNKGAGSEASLPVTLRVRRRAPKLLFPQDSVKNHKKAGRIAPLSGLIRPAYLCCFRLTYAKFFDYNQCNLTPKVWECRTEGFQRAIADFVCSHCPLVAPAGAKSPAQGCNHSNKYPSITFKVLSAPSRWLRSYPCDAYTPAPISPWRMSYPARKVASTSDP